MHSLKSRYLFLTILVLLFNVNQLQAEAPNPNVLQPVPRPQHETCISIGGVFCKIPLNATGPCYPTCTRGPLVPVPSNLRDCPFQPNINPNGPAALFCRGGPQLHRTCVNFHGNKTCKIPLGRQEPCYPGTPGVDDRCIEGAPVPAPSNLRVCPFQRGINANGPAARWCRQP